MMNTPLAQDMMGGAFGLELPLVDSFPWRESGCCAYLNSGRAAFECLLRNLPELPERVFVPEFVCDTLLEPLARLQLPVVRYHCRHDLSPILPDSACAADAIVLVNYFGLTSAAVAQATAEFPGTVFVDATTALFAPYLPGTYTFMSPRKFCGVPDGGVALSPGPLQLPDEQDVSAGAALHLLQRTESGAAKAFAACAAAESRLSQTAPLRMSTLTRVMLRSIDFSSVAQVRLRNYEYLHHKLGHINRLRLPDHPVCAPMCYPLVSGIPGLRDELVDAGVALPFYWPEVIDRTSAQDTENQLARTLLPLPLDQRYTLEQMEWLCHLILQD